MLEMGGGAAVQSVERSTPIIVYRLALSCLQRGVDCSTVCVLLLLCTDWHFLTSSEGYCSTVYVLLSFCTYWYLPACEGLSAVQFVYSLTFCSDWYCPACSEGLTAVQFGTSTAASAMCRRLADPSSLWLTTGKQQLEAYR